MIINDFIIKYLKLWNLITFGLLLQIKYFIVKGIKIIMAQNSLRTDDARVNTERRIPFEVSADPFYSKENMDELERRIANIRTGKSVLKEHDLIGGE